MVRSRSSGTAAAGEGERARWPGVERRRDTQPLASFYNPISPVTRLNACILFFFLN